MNMPTDKFRDRVLAAAEAALKAGGSVGPLGLFQYMRFLNPGHVESWRKGNEFYRVLEEHIQVGPEKFEKTLRHFGEWVQARGLRPVAATYSRRTPRRFTAGHSTGTRQYFAPALVPRLPRGALRRP